MKASVTWTEKDATFPAGTVAAGYLVTVTGGDGASTSSSAESGQSVDFELPPGSYTAMVARLDQNGAVLGSATASFVIGEPVVVTISIPDAVNVLVA